MTFQKYTCIFIFIAVASIIYGQQTESNSQNSDDTISLIEFIEEVERISDYRFYFKDEWLLNITINKPPADSDVIEKLNTELRKNRLNLYTKNNSVYIYPGKRIVTQLPSFHENGKTNGVEKETHDITEAEKNYLEGKMISSTEILYVGSKQQGKDGETCFISGRIRDKSSGEPLIGVTIYIESIELGAATGIDGEFNIAVAPGKYKIKINYLGMKEQEYYLQVYSSGYLTIEMAQELIEINEVTISASGYDNVKGMQMGFERLSIKSVKEIPAVMGEKDVIKIAQMLPGVVNVGEGASGFNVRGGSADQNMFYINKIPVYNTSHLFGFFTAFSPDVINNFTLYKSNIPARFGGRLSSIFDISTRQGNNKKFFAQGGISPVTARFSMEGPLVKDKSSVVMSWRSSYSDWILNQVDDPDLKNSNTFFYDASLGINTEINNKNFLKVFVYNSFDKFSLASTNDYKYSNAGLSINLKHVINSSLNTDLALVYSRYRFENIDQNNISEAYKQEYFVEQYDAKYDFNLHTSLNHTIEFGGSTTVYDVNRGEITSYGPESTRKPGNLGMERGLEQSLYVSDEFKIIPRLSLLAGLRYSFFAHFGPQDVNIYFEDAPLDKNNVREVKSFGAGEVVKYYHGPEYRAALNFLTGSNSSVKASYNRLRQYIFMLSNTIAISPNDQWKLADYHISPPVSDQISLGYYKDMLKNSVQFSVEIYQKWVKDVIEYKDGTDFISDEKIETQVLQGDQNARGLEVMIKKKSGKLTGWLAYTYSRSTILVNGTLNEEKINNGKKYPSNYDRPHSLNFVSNYRVNRRLSISANFVYTSGRPVTYPIAIFYSEGQPSLYYSDRNKYRIPDYIRMDLSFNLEGNLINKKLAHSYWMLNIYNVLGRDNAYSVYFTSEGNQIQGYKLSIFAQPIVTLSWNFKFGNYLND